MASGFNEQAMADAYAMAAGLERLAEAAPEVYDYHFAENEASLSYRAPSFDGQTLDFEEPTFDPRNKRGSTKKRGSDGRSSSDTGVALTPQEQLFYSDREGGEGEELDLDKHPEYDDSDQGSTSGAKASTGERNVRRRSKGMSRQKKQLLRAAVTDLSKDDLRRLAQALLDER